jgi:rhodanese-related sulfurtransferase
MGEPAVNVPTITPLRLQEVCSERGEVDLIDVRTPVEFREVHAGPARNVPLDRLDPAAVIRARSTLPAEPLYVICRSGGRGRQACEKLIAAGYQNVFNVEGGTLAWVDAGLPIVRGRRAMSLERQVRIAAGSLVLLGVALGWLVHEAFFGLAGFVGAGLIFAGLTDTCGMGLLLARMPWNRVPNAAPECGVRPARTDTSTRTESIS